MKIEILYVIIYVFYFCGLLLITEYLHKKWIKNPEITRKLAHVTSTLSCILFPLLFKQHWWVLILGIIFTLLLYIAKKRKLFSSIENVGRITIGSVLLPVSIYLIFFISVQLRDFLLFIIPLLILGISDPLAGLAAILPGTSRKKVRLGNLELNKTYLGSILFFSSSFAIGLLVFLVNDFRFQYAFIYAFAIAAISSLAEVLSGRGLDNLTIPVSIEILLVLFII